jgi:hypothetical protein
LSGEFDAKFVAAVEELIVTDYLSDLNRDLSLVPARLLGNDPELYNEYDRLQAEAQFRVAVSLPISFVATTLAVIHHPIWLLILLPLIALCATGIQRQRECRAVLAEAILIGRVESPVFDRFEPDADGSNSDEAYVAFKEPGIFMAKPKESD